MRLFSRHIVTAFLVLTLFRWHPMLALNPPPVKGRCPWISLFSQDFDRQCSCPGPGGSGGSTYCGVDCPVSHRQAKTARVQATLMFHVPWGGWGGGLPQNEGATYFIIDSGVGEDAVCFSSMFYSHYLNFILSPGNIWFT